MGAKKKIAIEEVDSSEKKEAAPVKAKKKITIEAEQSTGASTSPVTSPTGSSDTLPTSPSTSPVGAARALPASLKKRPKAAPKTGYEFERTLESCKTPQAAAEFMSLVKPASVPKLLRQNLTSDMMMEMFRGLEAGVEGGEAVGWKWIEALVKVNRFDIIVDFLSTEEKTKIGSVIDKLASGADASAVSKAKTAFKLA